jgi:hypothetical protein
MLCSLASRLLGQAFFVLVWICWRHGTHAAVAHANLQQHPLAVILFLLLLLLLLGWAMQAAVVVLLYLHHCNITVVLLLLLLRLPAGTWPCARQDGRLGG